MRKYILFIVFAIAINILNAQSFLVSKTDCNINFTNVTNSKIWYSYDLYQGVITYNPILDANQFIVSDNLRSNTFSINQITNFSSISTILDSFYSWKNYCIDLHKGSGGSIDTSNIVYTGSNASLKSLNITGVNGNGHIHLRHQNTYPSSTGQSTTIFSDSSGNFAWKNDGLNYTILNTGYQSTNRTFTFQNKSYTLADSAVVYNKLTATDTASLSNRINTKLTATDTASLSNRINTKLTSTDTASLSNRINTKLTSTDTASLSNRINAIINIVQNTTDGATVTGSVSNTISMIDSINANVVNVRDILELNVGLAFTGSGGGKTIRIYLNTIASLSGATQIGTFTTGATVLSLNMKRILAVKSSVSTMVAPFNTSAISCDATSTTAMSSVNIAWTSKQYIIVAIQLSNSGDSGYCPYMLLKKS